MNDYDLAAAVVQAVHVTKGNTMGRRVVLQGILDLRKNFDAHPEKFCAGCAAKFLDDVIVGAVQAKSSLLMSKVASVEAANKTLRSMCGLENPAETTD